MTVGREEIARALCEARGLDWDLQNDSLTSASGGDNEQDHYRHLADAVIALFRREKDA